jgi:hypothetical protein
MTLDLGVNEVEVKVSTSLASVTEITALENGQEQKAPNRNEARSKTAISVRVICGEQ